MSRPQPDWRRARLGEVCTIVSGSTPKTSVDEYWGGDIAWATPKDLSNLQGAVISDTPRKLTGAGLASCSSAVLPVGSVLFSSRAPIGHVAINSVPMATNQGFKSFVPDDGVLDAKFLYWWLKAHRAYMESLGNGATFKEVSKAVVEKVEVPLPPLGEQRRIAGILDAADGLRAKRRESIVLLDSLTQSIFLDMFGDPIANPRGFKVSLLVDLVDENRPVTYGILMPGENVADGVPYVRVVDIQDGKVAVDSVRRTSHLIASKYRRSILEPGDLLISIRGHVGRSALVPPQLGGANITQDTARLAIDEAHPRYVLECLRTVSANHWMDSRTKGAAVRGINLTDLKLLPVPLPPPPEQRRFAVVAEKVEREKKDAQKALHRSDLLFASLQASAFRGEL
jgi:type I restriction enzyme, S subunit